MAGPSVSGKSDNIAYTLEEEEGDGTASPCAALMLICMGSSCA